MGTLDDAPVLRLRLLRAGSRGSYVLEVGTSHDVAGTVERSPLRWWHPVLRSNVDQDLEPARFVIRDESAAARFVVERPGGTLRAGRLDLFDPDGAPLGRMVRRGAFAGKGYELQDAQGAVLGHVEGGGNPAGTGHDRGGRPVAGLERIHLRSGIVALGLGRIDGVERTQGRLLTSDPGETGILVTLEPGTAPLCRLMMIGAAVQASH